MTSGQNERRPWFKGYGLLVVVGGLIVGMYFLIKPMTAEKAKPRRNDTFTMVNLPPPPPPPPPVAQPTPPPVQQEVVQEEKMVEQAPVTEDDLKPEPPADEPPELGTGIKGDGPADGFGLSGRGNGVIGGRGGSANRSKWGWYAAEVQSSIHDALRKNRGTRSSRLRVTVRVWPDSTGRITRAQLSDSTGDSALDQAITEDVLTGLQLKSPPPQGMPSPIVLRISARRPN